LNVIVGFMFITTKDLKFFFLFSKYISKYDFINILIINKNMSRTILNINGDSRVINPRNGSAVFVDLVSNQSISGIKRFLSNLITNSNVNFNTTSNVGRVVFTPNVPVGVDKIVSIYTTNQTIGYGWFFDANGNLYFQDNIVRIIFYSTGNITCQDISSGAISAASLTCSTILTTGTITANGVMRANAGLTATTGAFTSNVTITGASVGLSITTGGIFTNRIDAYSSGIVVCNSEFNIKATGSVSTIVFSPNSTNKMVIYGIPGGTKYLYFNTSNILGLFNTSTGLSLWTIGNTGIGTFASLSSPSATITTILGTNISAITLLSTNTIAPYSGSTISINPTSLFKFLKSAGVSRINFLPNSTSGDIFQLFRTADNVGSDGYIYYNNSGNLGCYVLGVAWELTVNGDLSCRRISSTGYINTTGPYIYNQHNLTADICGLWSNRTGVGGTVFQNGNSWSVVAGFECNNGIVGGGGFNNGNFNRQYLWAVENTTGSGKALGLIINRTNNVNTTINTSTQSTNYALLGFYASNRGGAAYSFTGEHSSMVCDEEYDDLMNYNTDDFIGMVVCSSGKIYNLPYDVDGNTYTKQVDNIKQIDSQPMTRLSKKYKDKAVLGVISHIEKIGKYRNDLNATSWTACLSLDKDGRKRIRVASIGEGGIWITNEYGNIENGDYITTSNIAGYSTKQDDDLLHNYTICKATMNCSFDIERPDDYKTKYLGDNIYASYISCTFHCG